MSSLLRLAVGLSLGCAGIPVVALAQDSSSPSTAVLTPEHPAAARAAFRRAALAERAGSLDSALSEATRAADLWPVQAAYTAAAARLAVQLGDTAAVIRFLGRLAALEAGQAIADEPAVAALAQRSPRVARALAALQSALLPRDAGSEMSISPDTTWFAEGMDADPRGGALYVTSLRHRTIARLGTDGRWTPFLRTSGAQPLAPFAVAVDTSRGVLYAATGIAPAMHGREPADSTKAELLRIALVDGSITGRWPLADGRVTPGEMALLPDGDVLVSDALRGTIHRWSHTRENFTARRDPWLRSPQGLAPSADGQVVYIADWSSGLLRWDIAADRITRVAEPEGKTLVGIDGLRRAGDRLVGVQNGVLPARVVLVTLDETGTRATLVETLDRPGAFAGEPTVGALVGGDFVYVTSSQWGHYDDDGRRLAGGPGLPPVRLRRVPLPPSAAR